MNIFTFAMQMETDGKLFYEKLAAEAADTGLRNIFLRLAADEEKHYNVFQQLREGARPSQMEASAALEDAQNVFAGLIDRRETVLRDVRGDLEGYRYAMKIEVESVRLYEDAARQETNEELKALLLRIAAEEEKHYSIMENVYDFFNAPNEYLAWREFSNRGEFHQFGRDVDL